MQKLLAAKINKDDEMAMNLLKTAYYIAKRELPKLEVKHVMDYAKFLGVDFGSSDALSYTTNQSVSELQSAISQVILEDSVQEIKKSGIFSLTIDESTDRGNMKRLIMYTQCVNECGLKYSLLSNQDISEGSANAVNIVSMVVAELEKKGLDITKMVGIGTDGANVMTGRTGGVEKLLKEYSPTLIGVHCAAHRTALATSQAAKFVPHMQDYSRTVASIFRYFNNSALHSNRLRVIQNLLKLPELKFAEVHSVRWLSLDHAVQVVYRTYPALCMALEGEAAFEPTARGLLREVNQFRFIAITHFMMDVLPFMSRLSKKFQKETVDFSTVKPVVTSTCECLKDLITADGVFVSKLDKFVTVKDGKAVYLRPLSESDSSSVNSAIMENVEFNGFSEDEDNDIYTEPECVGYQPQLHYYDQQKNILSSITPDYIQKLTNNHEDRFIETEILENMSVLIPANICSAESIANYGLDEIQKLVDHFSTHLPCKEEAVHEFQPYKRLVKGNYSKCSVVNVLCILMKSSDLPNITILLKCCVLIPVTSVQCERGFSKQNHIKSKSRTSMKT